MRLLVDAVIVVSAGEHSVLLARTTNHQLSTSEDLLCLNRSNKLQKKREQA